MLQNFYQKALKEAKCEKKHIEHTIVKLLQDINKAKSKSFQTKEIIEIDLDSSDDERSNHNNYRKKKRTETDSDTIDTN